MTPTRILLLVALGACGCGPAPETDAGPAPTDAGDLTPPTCADAAEVYLFPTPGWIGPGHLTVPAGERAGAAVVALGWTAEVESLEVWPRRPTWVVALDRAGGVIDASRARVAVSTGAGFALLDVPVRVDQPSPRTLSITPRDPLPADATEVILALEDGIAGDAHGIPVCAGTSPHPDQVAAAEELGLPVDVAIRLRLGPSHAALVALGARLRDTAALTVESAESASITSLGGASPTAADAAHFRAEFVRGVLALPEYRRSSGPMQIDSDGAPSRDGTTRPGFVVALPRTGAAPFPTVLYQHGGGQSPLDIFQLGATLAEAGFAFVAIDLPGHGNRPGPLGGGDLDFIDFDSPLTTRENFRQASADHLAVLNGFAALNATVESTLGVANALDSTRRFYMGMSLGALTGSLTTTCARDLTASALFVGGGGFSELLSYGVFALAASRTLRGAEPRPTTMLAVVETILDAADPLTYARAAADTAAAPTPILLLAAADDPLISDRASDQWARAFGAGVALPTGHDVVGLPELSLPAKDNFSYVSGGPFATRVLVQNPMSEVQPSGRHQGLILTDYAQTMVTRCFSGARDGTGCEVIDTGFAGR